ncbi:hypothetical protein Syun_026529 [Stephania yunnanensis]|uniref:Uncharacterized protein n=1 Tax=Stephania yunnanensis TaxID=152371 RepID=A0AAP0EU49_9MAGN
MFQGAVRVMAKDLIRTRHQIEKFYKLKSQLQGVGLRIQGVSGIMELAPGYLPAAYKAVRKAGGLCIADEV